MKNLYKALAAFQQEVPVIHEGTQGYGYTYASFPTILKVINPLLQKHGLGFTQLVDNETLTTVLFHSESGESIESKVHIKQDVEIAKMNHYQVMGSAITYYRRYSLAAILGLVTDKDTDAGGGVLTDEYSAVVCSLIPLINSEAGIKKLFAAAKGLKDNKQFLQSLEQRVKDIRNEK